MVKDRPLSTLLPELTSARPLTISRWGDQEWSLLLGYGHHLLPTNGYVYIDQLRCDLWNVLLAKPTYGLAIATDDERATNAIFAADIQHLAWQRNPFAAITSLNHNFWEVVRACQAKPLVVVGPPRYRHHKHHLKWAAFVDVPPKNAYLCRKELVESVLAAVDDLKEPALITLSAGVCTPIVVHELYQRIGEQHQLVDVGGLWSVMEKR